jgi:ankyrin repeat protein
MSQSRPTLFNYNFDYRKDAEVENTYDKLLKATEENNLEAVRLLIQEGAYIKPTFRDTYKHNHGTPLHVAAGNGNLEILKILFQAKDAHVDVIGNNLSTPLHCAAGGGHLDVIKYLMDKGANIDAQTCHGYTALHFTLSNKKPDATKLLMDMGGNPYIKSKPLCSSTALEWAQGINGLYHGTAEYKNLELADYMIKNYHPEVRKFTNK